MTPFDDAMRRRLAPGSAAPLAVALSGGGDSLALLHLTMDWAERRGRPVVAFTVDHGLNADSPSWTRAAGDAARAVGADWRALRWEGPKPTSGVQARARAARHALLAEAARDAGARVLLMGHTADDIAEGEVMQLLNMRNADVTEEYYLKVIHSKTAKLFEAAASIGALIAKASKAEIEAAAEYGRSLGTAFQLIDDVLDYTGDETEIGKNLGDDLREGKMTLPLIYLMGNGSDEQRELVRNCIENGNEGAFKQILAAITASGGLEYARQEAVKAAQSAANAIIRIPEGQTKTTLLELCNFSVGRNH